MTARLVLIHGRAQEHKDAVALKAEWLDALSAGFAHSGLTLPIPEADVAFPYYGQTLFDLASSAATVAEVVVRGDAGGTSKAEQQFQGALLKEMQLAAEITDEDVEAALEIEIKQRGPLNWEWVQGILKVLDERVPGAGAASVALATRDVYQYLKNPGIRDKIEQGVRAAMLPGVPTVVVSHSLGTVVAFNLLRREGKDQGWNVPLLVTVGSPLGARTIRSALSPIEYPGCVGHWFNAMDERDVVALYPLDPEHFEVAPPTIENKTDVQNHTSNRHGIAGYLDDPVVAKTIFDALIA